MDGLFVLIDQPDAVAKDEARSTQLQDEIAAVRRNLTAYESVVGGGRGGQ